MEQKINIKFFMSERMGQKFIKCYGVCGVIRLVSHVVYKKRAKIVQKSKCSLFFLDIHGMVHHEFVTMR